MSGQEQPPKRPKSSRYVPFVTRTQGMGSTGWEAYTIGFTLVGCIVAGAGLGWLLDRQLKTSYWLPILFLVGVVAGFREMLATLKRISQNEAQGRKEKAAREAANLYTPAPAHATQVTQAPRERIFTVPPPPFETGGSTEKQTETDKTKDPETTEDLIKRLMGESEDEDDRELRKHQ